MRAQLVKEGILMPDGTVDTEKLNLISGMHTSDFVEALCTSAAGDPDTLTRVYNYMAQLYAKGLQTELFEFIAIQYGLLGLKIPAPLPLIATHPPALNRYLYEFLIDYDDVVGEMVASGS